MDNKRYQIFISSTFKDLIPERNKVIEQILTMGHIPVGMEMFSADDDEQWAVIQREIDRSDYYIVIVKHRYGSVIKKERNIGFTEKEYRYAGTVSVPRLGFIVADDVPVLPKDMDQEPALRSKLAAFKKEIMKKPVSFFHNPDELGVQVLQALTKQIAKGGRPGWERATEDSQHVLASYVRVNDENAALRAQVEQLRAMTQANVPTLDCQFIRDDGSPIGHSMVFTPPESISMKQAGASRLWELNSLVGNLDTMQRSGGQRTQPPRYSISAALIGRPYDFKTNRLRLAKQQLKAIEAQEPKEHWTFDALNISSAAATLFMPGAYLPPEPDGGEDFTKYQVFNDLTAVLAEVDNVVRRCKYLRSHCAIKLQLLNVSRAPAEDLTVRVEFAEGARIGEFALDPERRPELSDSHRINHEVELIPANDAVGLEEFVVEVLEGSEAINFKVRVTGRNLPEAQVFPMTIQIGKLSTPEADS